MNLATRRKIGGALWGVGVVVAVVWSGLRNAQYEAPGIGFAPPVEVSPLELGRLQTLDVQLHDTVGPTDVVARIDPSIVAEEREVLSAALLAVQEEQASAAANEARRFAEGVEGTLVDTARLQARIGEDRALIASLEEQLQIEKGLQDNGASSNQQVRAIERQLEVARSRLAANQSAYGVAAGAASAARARTDGVPAANEWHVVAATRQLEQVEGRLERLNLQAGIEGQVTAIYRAPGDVVQAGDPVLQVTRHGTNEVLAWLPTAATRKALSGGRAHVVRSSGEVLRGELVSVGSGPQQMPPQLWNNPASPEWGLPVRIQLSGSEIGAQEAVTVRI